MSSIAEKAQNYIKNPIGIIGLFLVLTEAIAALVIVKSKLNDIQNMMLVLFIALFPCIVLLAFYLLVTRHHKKLYSPSDYKDESNFVSTYNSVTQQKEFVVQKTDECQVLSAQTGMDKEDINFIKDSLMSVMELQKKYISNQENALLIEREQENIKTNLDNYLAEKEGIKELFKVEVSLMHMSSKLVSELRSRGFSANLYKSFRNKKKLETHSEHEAIWLGDAIPVDMAIEVIKVAKDIFPHLKYIELSDGTDGAPEYVKYQVFIGGATSTAVRRGLQALETEDFINLYKIKNIKDLHKFIRGFS
ncbi:hypothetical protein [Bacillus sp. 1NLA3E]|uniref:hypothetical protein n=1 Tax=Bacillus sp. 1NLA3E TaxID=666686 RepID=UPI000247E5BF|nr:hypothetical protein [Bacillus sp. 1NLA3E]